MAKYYYAARPARWRSLAVRELKNKSSDEWHMKARALQVRRWRALKHASKHMPQQELQV